MSEGNEQDAQAETHVIGPLRDVVLGVLVGSCPFERAGYDHEESTRPLRRAERP
ncbi:hypothetical protein J1792_00380 [Streptomyces triculaminicus]|uniref:Uncharacterized protein n=2 Tax=Streptomyces TaxID=1883 RepID=A0A939FHT2_9ACTN|nr:MULTISPECIES: hypothetical protein [Streptomyces]MBO0651309.1 hypothetical protein [Streptomyces triculaminicus]QSY49632.1 hypothetical protein J3S04_00375 [Streptomyces griseocarneus]